MSNYNVLYLLLYTIFYKIYLGFGVILTDVYLIHN